VHTPRRSPVYRQGSCQCRWSRENIEFNTVSNPAAKEGDRERRYREERPEDVAVGFYTPSSYRIDDRSEAARIWRDWLGLPHP
jgi:hypothetical protein